MKKPIDVKNLYPRERYLHRLRLFYDDEEIIKVLTGIRRCGKSTILKLAMRELIERGVPLENIIYLNLDAKPYKGIRKPAKLERVIDGELANAKEGRKYLFVDEIQNVKGYERLINAYRDGGGISIFITGSNSYLLSGKLATHLTGRYLEMEVSTLTYEEYVGMKAFLGIAPSQDEFVRYIHDGGFPLSVTLEDDEKRGIYIRGIISEIFEKDIRRNKRIRNRALFEDIQTYVINNFGSKTSVSSLCDYLSKTRGEPVKRETVYRYLQVLEDAKILSRCKRFDMKSRRSINGNEKYYLTDLGIYFARNVDNRINYGPCLENIVFQYAKSLGYQVAVGEIGHLECDFILRGLDNQYAYVQVCRTIDNDNYGSDGKNLTEEREYAPLEQIADGYRKYLLSLDRFLQQRSGVKHKNIEAFILNSETFC